MERNEIIPEGPAERNSLVLTMPFEVSSANADMLLRLRAGALADLLIQAAIRSADSLRVGFGELRQQQLVWVLSRMTIHIERQLTWYQKGTVETWPKDIDKLLYLRDFLVKDTNGQIVARATSGWPAIDVETRRPRLLQHEMIGMLSEMRDHHAIALPPEKLPLTRKGEMSEVKTTYFDIDLNGHVTSSRYIDWMMDTFEAGFHREHYPKQLSINYLRETGIGEGIQLTRFSPDGRTFFFEGYNKNRDVVAFLGKVTF